MEKLNKFYKKIHGSYFAFLGALISTVFLIISIVITLLDDPSFSFFTYYISNLGEADCSAHIVFNIGLMITSGFMIFFHFFLYLFLIEMGGDKTRTKLALSFGLLSSIGLFLVGLFPLGPLWILHRIASITFFVGGLFFCIIYGTIEYKNPKIPNYQAYIGFLIAIIFILFLISTILILINQR